MDLTQAYETLRERVLSSRGETAPGLAIFLQKGMAAWMEICLAVVPSSPIPRREQDHVLPTEVVMVMAQMVWTRYEETHS
jgi:hypothetical protein